MTFIELFAGIGGFRVGLETAGFKCVWACEIDKFARETYLANFVPDSPLQAQAKDEPPDFYPTGVMGDITTVDSWDIPDHDLLTAGFPCQAFSSAGRRKGFEDTRGTLFYEIVRIVETKKPRWLLLENVPGLLTHDSGKTFQTIVRSLEGAGYALDWRVLNTKNFGPPQNRRRIFIVGRKGGGLFWKFKWPEVKPPTKVLADILELKVDKKYYLSKETIEKARFEKSDAKGFAGMDFPDPTDKPSRTLLTVEGRSRNRQAHYIAPDPDKPIKVGDRIRPGSKHFDRKDSIYSAKGQARTLTSNHDSETQTGLYFTYQNRNQRSIYSPDEISPMIRTLQRTPPSANSYLNPPPEADLDQYPAIRRLTPRECFRLQGFPDSFKIPDSDSQAYKQAGNAVSPPVVTAIARGFE